MVPAVWLTYGIPTFSIYKNIIDDMLTIYLHLPELVRRGAVSDLLSPHVGSSGDQVRSRGQHVNCQSFKEKGGEEKLTMQYVKSIFFLARIVFMSGGRVGGLHQVPVGRSRLVNFGGGFVGH